MSTLDKAEFFEPGDKTSLICADTNVGETARASLRDLGFKFHVADGSANAIERLRYTRYDLTVLQDTYESSSLNSNAILKYLAPLWMAQRRYSMIVLIGSEFKTLDAMQAFSQSVQVVVNVSDLPMLTAILKKSWTEFGALYKTYREVFSSFSETVHDARRSPRESRK